MTDVIPANTRLVDGKDLINNEFRKVSRKSRRAAHAFGGTSTTLGPATNVGGTHQRNVVRLPVTTTRWRLKVANYAIRDEFAYTGSVTIPSAWWGEHAPNADGSWTGHFKADPAPWRFATSVALTDGQEAALSDWITDPAKQFTAHKDYVLSVGLNSTSTQEYAAARNYVYSGAIADVSALAPALTMPGIQKLAYVLEYEYVASLTDRIGVVMGDSITDGAATAFGQRTNYAQQYALSREMPMVVHAVPGGRAEHFAIDGYKWSRWGFGARAGDADFVPDFGVILLGTNDLKANRTTAQLKADLATIIRRLQGLGAKRVYVARILPRKDPNDATVWTSTLEALRVEMNAWISTLPENIAGALYWDHALRSLTDPEQLADEFKGPGSPPDPLHPGTAGHARIATMIP